MLSYQIYKIRNELWNKFMIYTDIEFRKKWSDPLIWNIYNQKNKNNNVEIILFLYELILELNKSSHQLVIFLLNFSNKKKIYYLKNLCINFLSNNNINIDKNLIDYKNNIYNNNSIINNNNSIINNRNNNNNNINNNKNDIILSSCFTPPEFELNKVWSKLNYIENLDEIDDINDFYNIKNNNIDNKIDEYMYKDEIINNFYLYLNKNDAIEINKKNEVTKNNNEYESIFKFDEDILVK